MRRSTFLHRRRDNSRAASRAGSKAPLGLLIALAAVVGSLAITSTALGGTRGTSPDTALSLRLAHTTHFNSAHYTGDTGTYQTCGSPPNSDAVWFKWVATQNGTAVADTFGSSFDTVLNVMDSNLNEISCNDDFAFATNCPAKSTSDHCSEVDFTATAGDTYYFLVGAYDGGAGGPGRITLSAG
jgi:hypothetical protein